MLRKISLVLALMMLVLPLLSACDSLLPGSKPNAAQPVNTFTQAPAAAAKASSQTPSPVTGATASGASATGATATNAPATVVNSTPQPTQSGTPVLSGVGKKMCQVTDTGGIGDQTSNAIAWRGLSAAQNEMGVQAKYLESTQPADYAKNIQSFIDAQCDLIVTVGPSMANDTKNAAEKNPNQKFVIVGYNFNPVIPNVVSLTFATDQAGFLAGYLAAGMSKSGRIATFGGMQVPTVTVFMDGFYYGAQYYNQQNKTKVQVLGWDPATQKGVFVGDFVSVNKAKIIGQSFIYSATDVIMPVAGPAGVGAADAFKSAGNKWIIGTNTDWTVSASNYKDIILTSVVNYMDYAVFDISKSVLGGTFKGGSYLGTLENNGVGLGTTADLVPPALKAKVDQVKADIVAGKIKVNPKAP